MVARLPPIEVRATDAAPGVAWATVSLDGGPPEPLDWSDGVGRLELGRLDDGEHALTVRVGDGAWRANVAEQTVRFAIDGTPPVLRAHGDLAVRQGRTIALWVSASEPLVEPLVQAFGRELPLHPVPGGYRALLGVPTRQEVGTVGLVVSAADRAGNAASLSVRANVQDGAFERGGTIRLSKAQLAARRDEEGKAAMRAERDAAYAIQDPVQRWSGPFRRPVRGRVTSPFGRYRRYSDGARSYHSGLDLANRRGAPVFAAAPGEVLVAKEQVIFGNVVIVGHGHGVTTSYNHLDRVDVAVGQQVDAGDPVGLLGNTGQSTGPHLHFGLVVGEVAVDPEPWFESGYDAPPWAPGY